MKETSKCREMRKKRGDFETYLAGSGIDIGAGDDPLLVERGSVGAWDLREGDAQKMSGIADERYDFVYSSHCLEHMHNVEEALTNWVRILKPGGFLYIVVPDYLLYEKMMWPSVYNTDHKQSFSFLITRAMVGRTNHHHFEQNLFPLLLKLGIVVERAEVESLGFDFNRGIYDQTAETALAQVCVVGCKR